MGLADPIPGDPPRGERRCVVGLLVDTPDQWGFTRDEVDGWLVPQLYARADRANDPGKPTFTYIEIARRVGHNQAAGSPRLSVSALRNHATKECTCHL